MAKLTPYQQNALEYGKHISLTANAGSGKTFVLAKRYVNVILNENINLRQIVAITFTEKAASELNKKIALEIDNRIDSSSDLVRQRKLEQIRSQLVSANISTIHSFCIDILKEFSPEAGLDANFVPIDQYTADELIELSVEEIIDKKLVQENCDDVKELIRLLGSKQQLTTELKQLIKSRKNVFQIEDRTRNSSVEDIVSRYRAIFESKFNLFFNDKIQEMISFLNEINNAVLEADAENDIAKNVSRILDKLNKSANVYEQLTALLILRQHLLTGSGGLKKLGYLKGEQREKYVSEIEFVVDIFKTIKDFQIDENTNEIELTLAKFSLKILKYFRLTVDLYEEKKRQRGFLDFEDILLQTKKILKNSEVQKYLSNQYKFLMIDEYQDTNELQYQIFMPILNELKTGNLFIVGDEKQSIYMFRDADIKLFNKTKERLKSLEPGSELLQLPHSFRLSPIIASFTNILFKELFADPNLEFNEVAYDELICAKPEDTPGKIELLISQPENENSIVESELVARKIKILLADEKADINLQDIAVLCRKRKSFEELEIAFSKHDIPYSVVGGKGYYQKQIISDFHNYLSFLISPDNDAALIGILRSPFFSISDTTLLEISSEDGNTFYKKLKAASGKKLKLLDIYSTLEKHISISKTADINILLREIIDTTDYLPVISARRNNLQELANLEKLISLATGYFSQGFKTLYDFVDHLKNSIQILDDEGQAQIGREENTVKILTIHKAKGLEFKAVFLFNCNDTAGGDSVKAKRLSYDKEFGIMTKVPVQSNYFNEYKSTPVAAVYNYLIQRKNNAELKRLLYVGITRAVQYLFISGTLTSRGIKKGSFLDLIMQGMNRDNFDEDKIKFNSKLKLMKLEDTQYKFYEINCPIEILITKEIKEGPNFQNKNIDQSHKIKNILVDDIKDFQNGEIISATKIAVYLQCPVKYYLTYELGYTKINKIFGKNSSRFSQDNVFNLREERATYGLSDAKGRIIHKILEMNIKSSDLKHSVQKLIEAEQLLSENPLTSVERLKSEIIDDINNLYASDIYNELKSYPNYKNEFELYAKVNDFYLYGIIDRLIFDGDRIIIIDYKTEIVDHDKIKDKITRYITQLLFYTAVANRIYKNKKIEVRLIFIKQPDLTFKQSIKRNEINDFKNRIIAIVDKLREENYIPNLTHCRQCHFADSKNKCIKTIE